jgi:2-polyprenyl-3-methyl-5-hydroxy-6-metoxy-1,4-benzoquinol methylase
VSVPPPRENIYGHLQRLDWFKRFASREDRLVELGCGTGYMISYPLRLEGYDVIGVDLDEPSVAYGREVLVEAGLDPSNLMACDLADVDGPFDAVIASEVLEHLDDADLRAVLALIRSKLAPGGRLLVTVPNGYGWFELESFLWFRTGLGRVLERLQVVRLAETLKRLAVGRYVDAARLSTVADSPHKQRFTWRSIHRVLDEAGYDVIAGRGSVLFAGAFSNVLFTGVRPVMRLNARLGQRFPRVAAGFYLTAVPR